MDVEMEVSQVEKGRASPPTFVQDVPCDHPGLLFHSSKTPILASERAFGFTFAAISLFVTLSLWVRYGELHEWLVGLATGLILVSWRKPKALAVANKLWLRLGAGIHKVTNPLVMGILFFTLFMPMGLLMRVFRRDLLGLRRCRHPGSFWKARVPKDPSAESMVNQF